MGVRERVVTARNGVSALVGDLPGMTAVLAVLVLLFQPPPILPSRPHPEGQDKTVFDRRSLRVQASDLVGRRRPESTPKHAFKIGLLDGREGRVTGHRRYAQDAQERPFQKQAERRVRPTLSGRSI